MEKAVKRIQTGRLSFIVMIVMTFVNAIAWFLGSTYIFPYSAFTPQLTALFAHMLYVEYGFNAAVGIWILISLALIALYYYLWQLTKTKAKGFFIALILFAIDTVLFVFSYSSALTSLEILFALAIHALILYHFYSGYKMFKANPAIGEVLLVKSK
jgi:hypothetical protein